MASARDLLLQADALMRNNRNVGAAAAEESVPVLTDIALPGAEGVSHRQRRDEIPVLTNAVDVTHEYLRIDPILADLPAPAAGQHVASAGDVATMLPASWLSLPADDDRLGNRTEPVLSARTLQAELSALETGRHATVDAPAAGPAAQALWIPQPDVAADMAPAISTPMDPAPAVKPGPDAEELAESVYFQVLQNLDLFTEQALQRQLTTHLGPIIEKANRELLSTLHANLGGLLRQFIADAIEKQLGVRPDASKLP